MKEQLEALIAQLVERGILYDEAVTQFEKRFIGRVLEKNQGNLSRAARDLGIHRNTLSRKVGLYRLDNRTRPRLAKNRVDASLSLGTSRMTGRTGRGLSG